MILCQVITDLALTFGLAKQMLGQILNRGHLNQNNKKGLSGYRMVVLCEYKRGPPCRNSA